MRIIAANVAAQTALVTRGLDPRVHLLRKKLFTKAMDRRVKPGDDDTDSRVSSL
jgi:hypothetical protein